MGVRLRTVLAAVVFFCLGVAGTTAPAVAIGFSAEPAVHSATGPVDTGNVKPEISSNLDAIRMPAFDGASAPAPAAAAAPIAAPTPGQTLAALVDIREASETLDSEHECLAGAVYFESKGEPLEGQLAVAEVIMNRAASGRFPPSICSVVFQPRQFSFVRGGGMPSIPRGSRAWQEAVAIARIARERLWRDVVPNAMFFHAARIATSWGKQRVAQLGHHIFYR